MQEEIPRDRPNDFHTDLKFPNFLEKEMKIIDGSGPFSTVLRQNSLFIERKGN